LIIDISNKKLTMELENKNTKESLKIEADIASSHPIKPVINPYILK